MNRIEPYPTAAAASVAEAIASILLELGSITQASLRRYSERRRERLAVQELKALPDHLLRDIGLTSYDIADGNLPLR